MTRFPSALFLGAFVLTACSGNTVRTNDGSSPGPAGDSATVDGPVDTEGGATDSAGTEAGASQPFEVYPPGIEVSNPSGYETSVTVTITAKRDLTNLAVALSTGGNIRLTSQCPKTLPSGQSCQVEVSMCYTGYSAEQAEGSVLIRADGDVSESVTVPVVAHCYSI